LWIGVARDRSLKAFKLSVIGFSLRDASARPGTGR
jgi:hypothetical protein